MHQHEQIDHAFLSSSLDVTLHDSNAATRRTRSRMQRTNLSVEVAEEPFSGDLSPKRGNKSGCLAESCSESLRGLSLHFQDKQDDITRSRSNINFLLHRSPKLETIQEDAES